MSTIEVKVTNQAELDAVIKRAKANPADWFEVSIDSPAGVWLDATLPGNSSAVLRGNSSAVLRGNSRAVLWENSSAVLWDNSRAVLWDSSSAVLWDNSSADLRDSSSADLWDSSRAVLWGSSRADLRDSSSAVLRDSSSAVLRGNSSADLWDNSSADLWDNSSADLRDNSSADLRDNSNGHVYDEAKVTAAPHTSVHLHSKQATVKGGVLIDVSDLDLKDTKTWIDHGGVERVGRSSVILYKAVDANLRSARGHAYPIGEVVTCPDWTDTNDCGGGLHLSPSPAEARYYFDDATRFLRCEVAVKELRPIPGSGAAKAKARVVKVLGEVDRWGDPVAAKDGAA